MPLYIGVLEYIGLDIANRLMKVLSQENNFL